MPNRLYDMVVVFWQCAVEGGFWSCSVTCQGSQPGRILDRATAKVEAHSCREVMTCVSEVVFGHWPQQDPFGMCQGCGGACCVLWQRLKSTGTDGGFEKGAAVGGGGLSPYSVRYLSALALMRVARDACSA